MIINGLEITRGLIIDEPWIEKILNGSKTWEMRSTKTSIRGPIALIKKGSGTIVGIANLHNCVTCDPEKLPMGGAYHGIPSNMSYVFEKWHIAWQLKDVERVDPIPYEHKQGAVIWVKL